MPSLSPLLPLFFATATVFAQASPPEWRIRVGDEGLTGHELDVYRTRGARELGKSAATLSADELAAIERRAIDEEILFQAAIGTGLLRDEEFRQSLVKLYESSQTSAKIEPRSFPDAEIEAFYRAHAAEFAAPAEFELLALQFGGGVGADGKNVDATVAQARRAPEKVAGWKKLGWVKAGDDLRSPLGSKKLEPVYKLRKGQVTAPLTDSLGTVYLFWCKDSKPAVPIALADCRAKVVHRMIAEKQGKLSTELDTRLAKEPGPGTAEQRKVRAAMAARVHRDWNLRQRIVNQYVADQKKPREALVESLRSKYRVAAPAK